MLGLFGVQVESFVPRSSRSELAVSQLLTFSPHCPDLKAYTRCPTFLPLPQRRSNSLLPNSCPQKIRISTRPCLRFLELMEVDGPGRTSPERF